MMEEFRNIWCRRSAVMLVWAWCAGLGMAQAASAGVDVSTEMTQPSTASGVEIVDGEVRLSLEDAIAIALERNLSLMVQRQNRAEASFRVFEAVGIYDPNATASLSFVDETSPSASNLDGADVTTFESQAANLGLSKLVSSGGVFSADWSNNRQESNSTFATLNPSYRVDFDLSFRQPLLANRGRLVTERGITVARHNLDASREDFEAQIAAVIGFVETEYWNTVEAREQLAVAVESLALAEELHEQNRIRVEVGTLAPLELVQSESGVATRQEEIIRSKALLGDAEDRLRQILNLDQGALWSTPLRLTSEADLTEVSVDLDEAIETALVERPILRAQRLRNQIQEIDVEVAKNLELPSLDLFLRYGFNGVGGDIEERDFFTGELISQSPGGYSDALEQVTDTEFDGWVVQLDLAYPIRNRAAKARTAIAEVALDRVSTQLADVELEVITEVRRTHRFLDAALQAVESARVSRVLAEKTLDAEQKRYDNGLSTSYQLLEIQEDLTAARSREVSSASSYRRAVIAFYSAMGRLLEQSGVSISEPEDSSGNDASETTDESG